jgi:hypothetical protein
MRVPYWLLKLLPLFDYICPKCKREVKQKSHKCPYCGENYGVPLRVPPKVLKDGKALEDYVHKHIFPKVSAWQREYLAKYFTVIFQDGFESGDFSAWTGTYVARSGTITVTSNDKHHGTYSARFTGLGREEDAASVYKAITAIADVFTRIYLKVPGEPSLVGWGATINYYGSDHLAKVIYDRVNDYWGVRFYDGYSWQNVWGSVAKPLTANTWTCLEFEVYVHSSAGYFKVWINGTLVCNPTNLRTDAKGNITRVYVGEIYLDGTETVATYGYYDCVVVADTYIGPEVAPKPKGSMVVHAKLAGVI